MIDTEKTVAWHIVDGTFSDMQMSYYNSQNLGEDLRRQCTVAFRQYCRDRIVKMNRYKRISAKMPPSLQMDVDTLAHIDWEIARCRQALDALRRG